VMPAFFVEALSAAACCQRGESFATMAAISTASSAIPAAR
jgi:hypothetical protein